MTALTWQLRRATADDLDAIMPLEESIFQGDAWSPESMRSELRNANCYYLVAFPPGRPGQIDGYAGLLAPAGAKEGDIQTIAVAPAARRHGLGRVLMRQLITESRTRGVAEVFLEVRADNPAAQNLYRELGFEQLGVRPRYYQPDDVDALVMRLVLPAPVTELATGDGA
jgi:ribosomal-protein-alanine acetyltransferase